MNLTSPVTHIGKGVSERWPKYKLPFSPFSCSSCSYSFYFFIIIMPSSSTLGTTALVLVIGMLVSGVCNTILNKFQDMQCVGNCDDPDPKKRHYFEQPIWQT
jgi:hypothetical protein